MVELLSKKDRLPTEYPFRDFVKIYFHRVSILLAVTLIVFIIGGFIWLISALLTGNQIFTFYEKVLTISVFILCVSFLAFPKIFKSKFGLLKPSWVPTISGVQTRVPTISASTGVANVVITKRHENMGMEHYSAIEYSTAEDYLRQGVEKFKTGDLDEALRSIYIGLGKDFDSHVGAELEYRKGTIFQKLKVYQLAIFSYERAIELNPGFVHAHRNAGSCYFLLGEFERSEKFYKNVIELDSKDFRLPFYLANLYALNDQYQDAEDQYCKAYNLLKSNEEYESLHYNYGRCFECQGKFSEAKNYYIKAISKNSDYARAYISLGKLCLHQKGYIEAEEYFKKFIRLRYSDPKGYYWLGVTYFHRGKDQKARENFDKCKILDRRYAEKVRNFMLGINIDEDEEIWKKIALTIEDDIASLDNLYIKD